MRTPIDKNIDLNEDEFLIVPGGVEHRPVAKRRSLGIIV